MFSCHYYIRAVFFLSILVSQNTNWIQFFFTDWDKENVSEPPPTKHISEDDLNKIATGEKNITAFIPKVMSHSIANERCVQATSKKVLVRKGYKNVHTSLLQTQNSISFAPYKASKKHILKQISKSQQWFQNIIFI